MKIDETAPLVFEYVCLPVVKPAMPFLFRFKGPFPTAWVLGELSHVESLEGMTMEKWALAKWKEIIEDPNVAPDFAKRFARTTVKMVVCEIVPEENRKESTVQA